jgi:Spondin_N
VAFFIGGTQAMDRNRIGVSWRTFNGSVTDYLSPVILYLMRLKFTGCVVALFVLMLSCRKNIQPEQAFSEARYRMEFTGQWKMPALAVPAGVHFTTVIGLVHEPVFYSWKEGRTASTGIENVAEAGNPNPLLQEIDTAITSGRAIALFVLPAPAATGTGAVSFYANSRYPSVSFITMLAPTPDWFTGLSQFRLFEHNRWVSDTTVNLYAWDAGTEEGDRFDYFNADTQPRQPVQLLTPLTGSALSNGNPVLAPVARVRFTKL